ncbi:ATP-binding protein [Aquiflexum sp. TKW24L]|uniref:ATP-binding protein n=1 Tax=Aquiflexum sp. TKW24L TaxID=2942212 RepID=UPI0020C03898|nr:ATP-binding protein [Aquiflexum sp. TKW24L]MCL6257503.1 ATP-binding protein [Aquiflexum sp. TKW24L]
MRKKLKSLLKNFNKRPVLTGIVAFLFTLGLTQFLTYKDYLLVRSSEREAVIEQTNLLENKIVTGLSFVLSATKTLSYLERKYGIGGDFNEIAREILQHNPNVDAIQLLEKGTIKYTYPFIGNEIAIGYDIFADSLRRTEAIKAMESKTLFFAGPFQLKQGGSGIVGRLPIFKKNEFWGFAAAVVRLETFYDIIGMDDLDQTSYAIQFSKINPDTGKEEFFLPKHDSEYSGHRHDMRIPLGDWKLSVQLKESQALKKNYLSFVLRTILSGILGITAWYLAIQPSILQSKVNRQSKQLKKSNERFEYATMATSDAIWDWDLVSNKVYRSDNFEKMFGYTKAEFNDQSDFWNLHIHPEDLNKTRDELDKTIQSKQEYWEQEFRFLKKEGNYAYVVDKGIIIRNNRGKAIRLIGATHDISKIKATELAIEKEKEFLNAMMENISEGIVACDDKGQISVINRATRNLFGLADHFEISDWADHYELFKPDGITPIPICEVPLYRAFRGEQVTDYEMVILSKVGLRKIVLCSGEEIKTTDGRKLGAVVVMLDITEKREKEKDLIKMSEELKTRAIELEISNSELEKFAYVASHDLQEPLRMITSFLKLIEKKYEAILDEKGKQYIHFATDGAVRMRQIIMDLLEYSRTGNSGKMEKFELQEIMEDVILLEKNHFKRLGAILTQDPLPLIFAAKAQIRQLMQNLINNALKYSTPGTKPEVHVSSKGHPGYWEISVRDNGIGVPTEHHGKIFQIFQRLHSREEYEGTGIGLAICKKIVESHQGKISIISNDGLGSTISFTLKKPMD